MPLGVAKAAGGIGLLAGLAVVTVARARWYRHLPFPGAYLLLATLTLRVIAG